MSHTRTFPIAVFLLGLGLSTPLLAQEQERSQIPDRFKWNLADVYPSDADWRSAKDRLASSLPELDRFKGQLGSSASTLDVRGFLVFQLLIVLREIANLNAACF